METASRAFLYGESVFTTMRMVDGVVRDWDLHFDRLKRGVEFVYGPFSDGDDWALYFKNRLEARYQQEVGNKILRLTIYREQARGLKCEKVISVSSLKTHLLSSTFDPTRVENKMIKLRTCPAIPRPLWWPSFVKAGNYLETILNQRRYLKPEDDDLLYLSANDTVLESSVANLFVMRHNTIYTPPVGPNVLEGIMRKRVMSAAHEFFDDCIESETTMEQLLKADAVFGCNSVRGVFLVDRIDDYDWNYGSEILNKFENLRRRLDQ